MKNYRNSDYALNKHSEGIVYRFADGVVEVTLEDYLRDYPDKTEADFLLLKEISDSIYLEQVRSEHRQTRKNVSFHVFEDVTDFTCAPVEEAFLDRLDRETAAKAFRTMLNEGKITEKQIRRFRLIVLEGFTFRETAKREGVYPNAIEQSVAAVIKALKKYFLKS